MIGIMEVIVKVQLLRSPMSLQKLSKCPLDKQFLNSR